MAPTKPSGPSDEFSDYLTLRLFGRQPRWRYFGAKEGGDLFGWTTERDSDGMFESFVYKAVGRGSRSGNARHWKLDADSVSRTPLRKEAKARALRLYQEKV